MFIGFSKLIGKTGLHFGFKMRANSKNWWLFAIVAFFYYSFLLCFYMILFCGWLVYAVIYGIVALIRKLAKGKKAQAAPAPKSSPAPSPAPAPALTPASAPAPEPLPDPDPPVDPVADAIAKLRAVDDSVLAPAEKDCLAAIYQGLADAGEKRVRLSACRNNDSYLSVYRDGYEFMRLKCGPRAFWFALDRDCLFDDLIDEYEADENVIKKGRCIGLKLPDAESIRYYLDDIDAAYSAARLAAEGKEYEP